MVSFYIFCRDVFISKKVLLNANMEVIYGNRCVYKDKYLIEPNPA